MKESKDGPYSYFGLFVSALGVDKYGSLLRVEQQTRAGVDTWDDLRASLRHSIS